MAGEVAGSLERRRVPLGVTGGIAAYKVAHLVRLLTQRGAEVQVVMTPSALRFVGADTFAALSARPVYSDVFEHSEAVLHVRLAREADVAVVARDRGAIQDLKGRRVAVTAGPTHEPFDPVRFLTTRSAGKMGCAVAREAARRGADVTLSTGRVSLRGPPGMQVVRVETAG